MKKIYGLLGTLLVLFFVFAPLTASADGMVIYPKPGGWDYSDEKEQRAYIDFNNGLEKMVIATSIETQETGKYWIFPLPSAPEQISIDTVTQLPNMNGSEIGGLAKSNLDNLGAALNISQLYTIPFTQRSYTSPPYDSGVMFSAGLAEEKISAEPDVVVHETLVKDGMTTEIVTAKTADGLFDHLKQQNLDVKTGSIPVLDYYIGKEYSFVVSWINKYTPPIGEPQPIPAGSASSPLLYDTTQYNNKDMAIWPYYYQRGLVVTFKTNEIFFPLYPTSVYGSKTVPADIRIMGLVTPKVPEEIKNYITTKYYQQTYAGFATLEYNFGKDIENEFTYTKISIDAPSKFLTADLTAENTAPGWVNYGLVINKINNLSEESPWFALFVVVIPSIMIISYLAAILSCLIIFKETRNINVFKYALVGLFNGLTIVGLILATIFWKIKKIKEEDKAMFEEIKKRGYSINGFLINDWRKFVFVPLFSILFLILSWAIVSLMALPFN